MGEKSPGDSHASQCWWGGRNRSERSQREKQDKYSQNTLCEIFRTLKNNKKYFFNGKGLREGSWRGLKEEWREIIDSILKTLVICIHTHVIQTDERTDGQTDGWTDGQSGICGTGHQHTQEPQEEAPCQA